MIDKRLIFGARSAAVFVAPILFMLGACTSSTTKAPPPSTPAPVVQNPANLPVNNNASLDPCADRLHELTGLLLEYYGIHHTLPTNLGDAAKLSPHGADLLTCPVSHLPYVYDPHGPIVSAGGAARVIVYDATPVHHGTRYGIVIAEPSPSKPLSADVKEVPEVLVKKSP